MLGKTMPPLLRHTTKIRDICIDCFMPSHSSALYSSIGSQENNTQMLTAHILVSFISLYHFTRKQHPLQVPSEYVDVWPFTSWKRTVNPKDINSLNANSYFIP